MVNVKALYDDRRIQELRLALTHSEEEKKQMRRQMENAREGLVLLCLLRFFQICCTLTFSAGWIFVYTFC